MSLTIWLWFQQKGLGEQKVQIIAKKLGDVHGLGRAAS
jgi:hypothetical protein